MSDPKHCLHYFKRSLELNQQHFESAMAIANFLMANEKNDRALKYFKHAIKIKPEDERALLGHATSLYRVSYQKYVDDPGLKSSTVQGIPKEKKKDTAAMKVLIEQGDLAIDSLMKILDKNSENGPAHRLLGEIYL